MKSILALLPFCLLPVHPAFAIDPGTVQGSLEVGGAAIPLKHAHAQLHDNAEKLLDRPRELRIALTDREVPQEALAGIAFLPVTRMAKEGQVRGLLLQLDPDNPRKVEVTVLQAPADPRQSLMTQTLSATAEEVVKKLTIANNRAGGEIAHSDTRASGSADLPKVNYALRFSAPLFHEPAITADLKGKAAQDSPQARVLREKARALAKGDFDAVRRISTARANRQNDAFIAQAGAQAKSFAKEAAADLEKSLRQLQRVVVRGERAVAIFAPNEWMNFARDGGEWRSDD